MSDMSLEKEPSESNSDAVGKNPTNDNVIATNVAGAWALPALLLLAILTVLYLARDLILPVVAALILSLVFLPLVRGMKKIFIPVPLGAGLVVLGLMAGFASAGYNLSEPASEWLEKAPQSLKKIDKKLRKIAGSMQDVASATEKVQDITEKTGQR